MASDGNIFAAFGAVLGYVGAEAATTISFERLLWPQRSYSHLSWASAMASALLMPMGGPLHKAALETLDVLFRHGLFKGTQQGHMLGTAFFPQVEWNCTMYRDGEFHFEPLRNCLWARALSCMPIPVLSCEASSRPASLGSAEAADPSQLLPLRARIVVSHLTLSRVSTEDLSVHKFPFVAEGTGRPGLDVFLIIFVSEMSAILTAIGIFWAYRTAWGFIWLVPLLLRLLSTIFTLEREPLLSPSSTMQDDPPCDFEVHCPESEGIFIILTGPPALVLQFFRHYGHPVRNRLCEILQLGVVMAFACLFPIGLFCSSIWMPTPVQYAWLYYQLYVVLAMHFMRYSGLHHVTTTEVMIAKLLSKEVNQSRSSKISTSNEATILFGQRRYADGAMKVSVINTYHTHYSEGKENARRLLLHRESAEEKRS
jgi:hypothetical protein